MYFHYSSCSVACYKVHKDSPKCVPGDLANERPANAVQEEPTLYEPFTTDDTVPSEKLQQLGECAFPSKLPLSHAFFHRNLPESTQLAPQSTPSRSAPSDRCGYQCSDCHDGSHAGAPVRGVRQRLSSDRGTHDGYGTLRNEVVFMKLSRV